MSGKNKGNQKVGDNDSVGHKVCQRTRVSSGTRCSMVINEDCGQEGGRNGILRTINKGFLSDQLADMAKVRQERYTDPSRWIIHPEICIDAIVKCQRIPEEFRLCFGPVHVRLSSNSIVPSLLQTDQPP